MNLNDNSFLSYIYEPSDSKDYQKDFQKISARKGIKKDSFHSSYSCSGLNELFRNTNHSNDTNIYRMNLNDNSFLSYISEPSGSNDS